MSDIKRTMSQDDDKAKRPYKPAKKKVCLFFYINTWINLYKLWFFIKIILDNRTLVLV